MLINAGQFPIVRVQFNATSVHAANQSPFADFDALLDRNQPFVFINDEGLGSERHEQSQEEMQAIVPWRKKNRHALRERVKGSIYIEPDTDNRMAAESFARTYEKFWGYPMLIVADENEALALAQKILTDCHVSQQ